MKNALGIGVMDAKAESDDLKVRARLQIITP